MQPRRRTTRASHAPNGSIAMKLNHRFMGPVGVLLHQFVEYDNALAPWQLSAHHPTFSDRISTTLINSAMRCRLNSTIPTYSNVLAGLVLSPALIKSSLQCAYSRDGGTEMRVCNRQPLPAQLRQAKALPRCVPGCYSHTGKPIWCSKIRDRECAWPADMLLTALTEQRKACRTHSRDPGKNYNELVLAPHAFNSTLPKAIEAVFFIRQNGSACLSTNPWVRAGDRCEKYARLVHARILRRFRIRPEKLPLLRLDLRSWSKPFRTVSSKPPSSLGLARDAS